MITIKYMQTSVKNAQVEFMFIGCNSVIAQMIHVRGEECELERKYIDIHLF